MKTYANKQIEKFSSAGYTVKHLTKRLILVRRYSRNAHRWVARLPIYDLCKVEHNTVKKGGAKQ